MLKSLIIAFSTYSKIPMPKTEWDEKSMKYSMCFFPAVGMLLGVLVYLFYELSLFFNLSYSVRALLFTALPILYTGGIHMDGFLDTVDAKGSYQPREKRLAILKDPHIGSAAFLYGSLYLLASFVLWEDIHKVQLPFIMLGFVLSRAVSGFSVVTLRKAKDNGMVADIAGAANEHVKIILLVQILCYILAVVGWAFFSGGILIFLFYGLPMLLAVLFSFLYYRYVAYKWFGGITGDLAGFFLQLCELAILIGLTVGYHLFCLYIRNGV